MNRMIIKRLFTSKVKEVKDIKCWVCGAEKINVTHCLDEKFIASLSNTDGKRYSNNELYKHPCTWMFVRGY